MKNSGKWCILGVDPGSTTGVVFYSNISGFDKNWVLTGSEVGQALSFAQILESVKVDVIVLEDFLLTGRNVSTTSRQSLSAARVGAMCHLVAVQHGFDGSNVVFQLPSFAKNHVPDQRLRQLGVWDRSVHVRDAIRHVLAYCRKNGLRVAIV